MSLAPLKYRIGNIGSRYRQVGNKNTTTENIVIITGNLNLLFENKTPITLTKILPRMRILLHTQ